MKSIVIVGEIPPRNRHLADHLREGGYEVARLTGGEETLRFLKERGAELIIVGAPSDIAPRSFLHTLEGRFPEWFTLLLLDSPEQGSPARDHFLDLSGRSDEEVLEVLPGILTRAAERERKTRLIGRSEAMERVRRTIELVAPTSMTVLITGESGSGKDVVARLTHDRSDRADRPFVAVNCAALPEGILESELFGHEKGAFTGATARRQGRFELAHPGTLFLDEIGDMPIQTQAKLLRVLEEKRFLRVGGVKDVSVDVRLIAATNTDLEAAVGKGSFRKDLFYRLNVIHIDLPPLRDRREDIPELVELFIREAAAQHQLEPIRFSADALAFLSSYHWPGNIRQLRNLIEKMIILEKGRTIDMPRVSQLLGERFSRSQNLPVPATSEAAKTERELIYQSLLAIRSELAELKQILLEERPAPPRSVEPADARAYHPDAEVVELSEPDEPDGIRTAADFEREGIRLALQEANGNRRKAAEILGIGERTLYRKLKCYGLG